MSAENECRNVDRVAPPREDLRLWRWCSFLWSVGLVGLCACPHYPDEECCGFVDHSINQIFNPVGCGAYETGCRPGLLACLGEAMNRHEESECSNSNLEEASFGYDFEFDPSKFCLEHSGASTGVSNVSCDVFREAICLNYDDFYENSLGTRDSRFKVDLLIEDSSVLTECMDVLGSRFGLSVERCESPALGESVIDPDCEAFLAAMDRLDECIEKAGPQRFPHGICFLPFSTSIYDEERYCAACPWWSSWKCFEDALRYADGAQPDYLEVCYYGPYVPSDEESGSPDIGERRTDDRVVPSPPTVTRETPVRGPT